jgi:hypothetical protein
MNTKTKTDTLIAEWGSNWRERLRNNMNDSVTVMHGMVNIAHKVGMDGRTLIKIAKEVGIEKSHIFTLPGDVLLIRSADGVETIVVDRTAR